MPKGSAMPNWTLVTLVGCLTLTGCPRAGGGGGGDGDADADGDGDADGDCVPTTIPWLSEGNFWAVAWTEIEIDKSWSGTFGDYDAGDYVMTLGAPTTVDGKTMYPLSLNGDSTKYAPLWSAIGTDGCGNVLGQTNAGTAPVLIHSPGSAQWSGSGFYTDFAGATQTIGVHRGASMVPSRYTGVASVFDDLTAIGYTSTDVIGEGTGCEYFEGYGTICGSSDPGNPETEMNLEYWSGDAGPIGMHVSYDYEDCLGDLCNGRHAEQRVEVYHFGDVEAFPSAFETEPNTYADPTPLPLTEDELFTMFASVNLWDTPSGTLPGYEDIHDWYEFEITPSMVDRLTAGFFLVWNDDANMEMYLFTTPDDPDYGFNYLDVAVDYTMEEFQHAKALEGTYSSARRYLLGVVRRSATADTTNYGILTFASQL